MSSKADKLHYKERQAEKRAKECDMCHENPCKCDAGEKL